MRLRPFADDDLTLPFLGTIPFRADRWRDAHTRSTVLEVDGHPVAAGIMWTSRVHGDRYWLAIVVEPASRGRGYGNAVFAHLSTLRAAPLAFMTRGYVDDDALGFADALGARTIQVVPPADVTTASRAVLRPHPAVQSVRDLRWDDVLDANAAVYAWTHAAWSPVAPDFAAALSEDLEAEVDRDASSAAVVDGAIVALALVYHDSTPPCLTAETTRRETADGERLIEACVRRSLDVLAARGVELVTFDGHVSDPHFLPVWARLAPSGRWFRLVEIPPAAG
ncbi:hypothetical protein DEU37_1749 [Microbacterium sp. AG790]|uniref:GNAT family N-acetyltransferase n=1 Tax=Microbacterium sp. AG790 TaxID=2183995 RepID=UPI000EAFE1B1|nr:GNAT family N-acetyltransferase [Microbacterium sp. AG790]RKS89435.1 hypothetical protein DEU37_1749 [Microbacterium sp. AG790]